jgi:chemotaxis protein methyltransferase CheR
MNVRSHFTGHVPEAMVKIPPHHIEAIAQIARKVAGIRLSQENIGFMTRRLPQVIAASGEKTVAAYIQKLNQDPSTVLNFIEALTVHTTSFFREDRQYRWLMDAGLPQLVNDRSALVIWSAACSTGQEGWSAMMVCDQFRKSIPRPLHVKLIGTDISPKVVQAAQKAVYRPEEIEGVPPAYLNTYFMHSRSQDGRVRIVPELRTMADWRVGNLSTGEGLTGIKADVAFLRNVLIYFAADMQAQVINRVAKHLRPGGYLLTGHSETGVQHPDLIPIEPSIYQRKPEA